MVQRDDFYGVVALRDGQPVGSNFLSLMDLVAGVGPITIDSSCQGEGVGRALMQDVIDYARRNNIEPVRLLQDSFNVASLSLYASLGFDVSIEETAKVLAVSPGTVRRRNAARRSGSGGGQSQPAFSARRRALLRTIIASSRGTRRASPPRLA